VCNNLVNTDHYYRFAETFTPANIWGLEERVFCVVRVKEQGERWFLEDHAANIEAGIFVGQEFPIFREWSREIKCTEFSRESVSCLYWPRVAVTDIRGQFGNPEEGEVPPLEAVTRGLVKTEVL
jgi:hypothetical protein